uniref:Uncharacterized protein n=1 Tax=Arundo donax TaxID=35708 RepID=A0A0A9AXA5_ARUDO
MQLGLCFPSWNKSKDLFPGHHKPTSKRLTKLASSKVIGHVWIAAALPKK